MVGFWIERIGNYGADMSFRKERIWSIENDIIEIPTFKYRKNRKEMNETQK